MKLSIYDRIGSILNTDNPGLYIPGEISLFHYFFNVFTVALSISPVVQAIISATIQCQCDSF